MLPSTRLLRVESIAKDVAINCEYLVRIWNSCWSMYARNAMMINDRLAIVLRFFDIAAAERAAAARLYQQISLRKWAIHFCFFFLRSRLGGASRREMELQSYINEVKVDAEKFEIVERVSVSVNHVHCVCE